MLYATAFPSDLKDEAIRHEIFLIGVLVDCNKHTQWLILT